MYCISLQFSMSRGLMQFDGSSSEHLLFGHFRALFATTSQFNFGYDIDLD